MINKLRTNIVFLFCIQLTAGAQSIYPQTVVLDTTLLELPSIREDESLVVHQGYVSSFNEGWHIPEWVAYELTAEEVQGGNERAGSFKQDKSLPLKQASNSDYLHSGYDKGHMAPAADMKWSETVMSESFYFTNICPQKPRLNREYWLALEDMTREAARRYGSVWVISGVVVASDSLSTIGKNEVCVPDQFYKALLSRDGESYFSVAFLLDNTDDPQIAQEKAVTVDSLEVKLSIDLFRNLHTEAADTVESTYMLSRWLPDYQPTNP